MQNPMISRALAPLRRAAIRAAALAVVLATTACASIDAGDGPGSAAERQLAAGIAQYDQGDYVSAIRTLLTSDEIWRASVQTQVTARKYLAFSHCLSDRVALCRQSFVELLRIQPDFRLAAAEAGHPQWGKVFEQARREVETPKRTAQPLAQAPR